MPGDQSEEVICNTQNRRLFEPDCHSDFQRLFLSVNHTNENQKEFLLMREFQSDEVIRNKKKATDFSNTTPCGKPHNLN
jgi:hypothetical protein